jgi:hypothetical protein
MNARRARNGAGGSGFTGGVSTTSESLREGDNTHDDDDDLLDAPQSGEDMQERVLAQRSLTPPDVGDDGGFPNPRQRMNRVQLAGSQNYSREYRLVLLHRMLMRRMSLDQIAESLGVSISTVEKDRVLLKAKLREESRALHIDEMVGGQMEVYNEISGMALRIASDTGNPALNKPGQTTAMRLAAMRTALATEADRTRFLNTAGVFDVLNYRRQDDGSDVSDVQRLMGRTEEMLERLMSAEGEDTPAPARKRIPRTGGFSQFTMDDKDASSGDAEVQDI